MVTENFPTPPLRNWLKALVAQTDTEVWSIDTACLVSLESSRTLYKRAFTFRDDLASERKEALHTPYPNLELATPKPWTELPHPKLPLANTSLSDLIASCPIDHTVPPVRDTVGGSRAALARWNSFRAQGLKDYHARRNDAATQGVSRMSAYLHYGHISPFRLAREAQEQGGRGGKKYLDELLVWRELAYHWCDKVGDPEHWNALPSWARETLQAESATLRDDTYSWESLVRARTHDELWNLAQESLLHHGELHNNLRMTWGKTLHRWTRSPEETLRRLIDLNHRYALDGRDPASYGGLLVFRPVRPAVYTLTANLWHGAHTKFGGPRQAPGYRDIQEAS